MFARRRGVAVAGGLLVLSGLVGCADPDQEQIRAQAARITELEGDKNRLERDLLAARREADAQRRRAEDLLRQLDLAQRTPTKGAGEFTESGPFAWVNVAEDILFDSGKAELKSSGRQRLGSLVQTLQSQYADRQVWVIGHTDSDPIKHSKWKDNLELSLQRGRTVSLELMSMGVSSNNVIAAGAGEFHPAAANDTKENKRKNRRVQIVAVAGVPEMGGAAEPAPVE